MNNIITTPFRTICLALVSSFCLCALTAEAQTVIPALPYTVTSPGVYILNSHLTYSSSSGNAITINANNVTIDFRDYSITGTGSSSTNATGIFASDRSVITIRNGTVTGFKIGILLQASSNVTGRNVNNIVENMRLPSNKQVGISLPFGITCRVEHCQINRIGGSSAGINAIGVNLPFCTAALVKDNEISTVIAGVGQSWGILADRTNAFLVGNKLDTMQNGISVIGNAGVVKLQSNLTINVTNPYNLGDGGVDAGLNN